MGFFGQTVDTDILQVPIPTGFQLAFCAMCVDQAYLADPNPYGTEKPILLTVATGNDPENFVVGAIHPEKGQYQTNMKVVFSSEDSPVTLSVTRGTVHITGTWTWDDELVSQAGSGDEQSVSGSEEESEEEGSDEDVLCHPCGEEDSEEESEEEASDDEEAPELVEPPKKKVKDNKAKVKAEKILAAENTTIRQWKVKPWEGKGTVVPNPKEVTKPNGLRFTDYAVGDGSLPKDGAKVKILYTGMLASSGKVFAEASKPREAFCFRKGTNQAIAGMDQGIEGMRVGGAREIYVPHELGYGKEGAGKDIPPKADLIFRVRLIQ